MSDDEVKRMKEEAAANAEADKKEKERIDKLNQADSMIFQTEKQLKESWRQASGRQESSDRRCLEQIERSS